MNTELKERKDTDPAYHWDLSTLYANDEAWQRELDTLEGLIKAVEQRQGTLHDAEAIAAYFAALTALNRTLNNLFTYASLRQSEDTRAAEGNRMYARIFSRLTDAESRTAFAEPEILALPIEELEAIRDAEVMAPYRFTMDCLIRRKPHTLTAGEEELLARLSQALRAPQEIAEKLMDADLTFASVPDEQGQMHEVSGANYILHQQSPDRTLRRNAFFSLYKGYATHIHTFAAAYAGAVHAAIAEAAARHYTSSREMSMAEDHIPTAVYDQLIAAVHDHMDVMHRYVRLRKKLLGVDELHYYDLYAPLSDGPEDEYTYEQAREMVLSAVAVLGEDYVNTVRRAFSEGWIDVYPNKGKTGGAYSSGTYDSAPYILLNYTNTLESVSTIAHEMGHSMHSWLANHAQPAHLADYTMFVAEVASTVNENLMIEQLLKNCDEPRRRMALLNQYLESFKGTVYRQTMFADFEMKAHALAEQGEALDAETLNHLYLELIREYFGEDLVIDDEVKYEWARIPHFYMMFYVYVYATGYSSAAAISQKILNEGPEAVGHYLEFLQMGGSRFPLDELRHAGVDLMTPQPVATALDKFAAVLAEAETLAAQLETA